MATKHHVHPVPESSTEQVLENLLLTGSKEEQLAQLVAFYNCPVCSKWRKITQIDATVSVSIRLNDPNIIAPRFDPTLTAIEVFPPYAIRIDEHSHKMLDLGFAFILPDHFHLTFTPNLFYMNTGLIVQSPLLAPSQDCIVGIGNLTDAPVQLSRGVALGYYTIHYSSVVDKINFSKVK